MNRKHLTYLLIAVQSLPMSAHAQVDETTRNNSLGHNLLVSVVPLVIIFGLILLIFRFQLR